MERATEHYESELSRILNRKRAERAKKGLEGDEEVMTAAEREQLANLKRQFELARSRAALVLRCCCC